jgi:nucleoside-diphosphate-sugar epimerase
MRICITGAGSTVARKVIEVLEVNNELTLIDVKYPDEFPSKSKRLVGSVLDRPFMRSVLAGQDVVIHMAIADDGADGTIEDMWEVNVGGTLTVVQESVAAAVKKFIYTSSISVFDGYGDLAKQSGIDEDTSPRQSSFYGFTKYLGETIIKFYAENRGMKSVVLRLMAVVPEPPLSSWAEKSDPEIQTSALDVSRAFKIVLEKDLESGFDIFHVTGGHPKNPWSCDKAKRLLGFAPSN